MTGGSTQRVSVEQDEEICEEREEYVRRGMHPACSDYENGEGLFYGEVPDVPPPFVTYRRPNYGVAAKTTCAAIRSSFSMLFLALLLSGAGFLVWPASTEVVVRQIRLDGIDVEKDERSRLMPTLILHISMELLLEVNNANFFGVRYDNILVRIFYRGDEIGQAALGEAEIPPKRTVLVPALLDLQGQRILKNVAALWADTLNRKIPFDTVTEFSGAVELFSWRPHVKVAANCQVTVDPKDKIILAESCSIRF